MDVPVVGEEPDREAELLGNPGYTVAAPDDFTYYINGLYWYDVTDESIMQEGDVFSEELTATVSHLDELGDAIMKLGASGYAYFHS